MIYLIFYSLVLICTKIVPEISSRDDFIVKYSECEVIAFFILHRLQHLSLLKMG
jgi:hypothetical protein